LKEKKISAVNFSNFWSSKPWIRIGSGYSIQPKMLDPDQINRIHTATTPPAPKKKGTRRNKSRCCPSVPRVIRLSYRKKVKNTFALNSLRSGSGKIMRIRQRSGSGSTAMEEMS
jgi:hypothetical protein